MTVYDTFMLRDELDMLECRLEELDPVVDVFVVSEAPFTHGERHPKPLYFQASKKRFARWLPKIRYVTDGDVPHGGPWDREHHQREACRAGLFDARPGDVVLHGDVDEVPSRVAVQCARSGSCNLPVVFEQRMTHYAVDWLDPGLWPGTIATWHRDVTSMQALRARRWELQRLGNGGWHLSNLGSVADQVNHVRWGCHIEEVRADGSWDGISSGEYYREGWHAGTLKLEPADVDDSWPSFIYERRCPASWFRPRADLAGLAEGEGHGTA